jgi:hypothetical protein
MIINAGGEKGFVEEADQVFIANNVSVDYHDIMDCQYCENWFENCVLKKLEEPSLIVIDNARSHQNHKQNSERFLEKKNEILTWKNSQNITLVGSETRAELLKKVREVPINIKPVYAVDEMAFKYGHEVLRLSPCDCHFNAIEMV